MYEYGGTVSRVVEPKSIYTDGENKNFLIKGHTFKLKCDLIKEQKEKRLI
jgi:hypothetical protein